MDLRVTGALALLALVLTAAFGWVGARPARPFSAPRLAPWRLFMLFAFAMLVALLVHAVALLRGGADTR